ncbi:hypothetical protein G6F16_004494 [Rhizopus arrhizus]|uniref:Vacuolar protein 8 n=1 Tax=Rhizopus oryzae TaxID=64495 RepID=A0A9P7BV36_RHIOR|nr:hypothetical protein G6F23_008766 [Rhizopus arrhizus]KAG0767262.1 hypothetical protein G6F24_002933 [Rhizopus arrhizus]KAG0794052.1 hypothetical protein G6F21_003151 [Rhizopus arrhizus]KAG0815184.1 hypothetical protein G6F20_004194 [Rhizopus arrhizus]KAG0839005.1 hypothetical protein G6F18_004299 [Rhizopus arrhizus]
MDTKSLKVQCQAALALRNLASDEKYQLEIVRCKGLTPLLRLLKSSFLPLILSSVACIRNISIHPANESPIIDGGFVNPLIELLAYDDNEEIQCHAISTLRNLAASSERNKRAIVEAGAIERIKALINKVPQSVQTEMTAAIAVLALSDELKQRLLSMDVLDILIELTSHTNLEVEGNSAAAIGNLSSKVPDYTPFVNAWKSPFGGLEKFLIRFLSEDQDVAFQHIGIWTIEQFIDGGDERLLQLIASSHSVLESVERIMNKTEVSSNVEDMDDNIHVLAKRVHYNLQEISLKELNHKKD